MKEDTKRWRDFPGPWSARIKIVKNGCFTKSNLPFWCNSNQITRLFLHRQRKMVSKIYGGTGVFKTTLNTKKTARGINYTLF